MSPYANYPKVAIAVDLVILHWDGSSLSLPLVRRKHEPFRDCWALPGGFMEEDETLIGAARRELAEETGLDPDDLLPGPIFDRVDRDPRGRVLSAPHAALATGPSEGLLAGSDAADAQYFPLAGVPEQMAFDHGEILIAMLGAAAEAIEGGRLGQDLADHQRRNILDQLYTFSR